MLVRMLTLIGFSSTFTFMACYAPPPPDGNIRWSEMARVYRTFAYRLCGNTEFWSETFILSLRIMKNILFAFVVVLLDAMGCGSRHNCPEEEVRVNLTSLSFDYEGGQQVLDITSNTSWTISGTASWCHLSTTSGTNNQSVIVTVAANQESRSRICVLTIISTDGTASEAVTVTQSVNSNLIAGTKWESVSSYSDGSRWIVSLSFTSTDATLLLTEEDGLTSQTTRLNYTYRYTNGLVVLTPKETGNAVLEGRIENNMKMTLVNTSNGSEIAVLYKQ